MQPRPPKAAPDKQKTLDPKRVFCFISLKFPLFLEQTPNMKNILFIGALALYTPLFSQEKKTVTLEDVWLKNTFSARSVGGFRSLKDGKHYAATSFDPENKVVHLLKYQYTTGKITDTLFNGKKIQFQNKPLSWSDYQFSSDESKALLETEAEGIYRRSAVSNYYVLDVKSGVVTPLSSKGKQREATFSPDGSKVAFARDNNLFVVDLTSMRETQITTDGKQNTIINGTTDWVCEEELEYVRAFFWSPDSKHLAFLRFDETSVPEFTMPKYKGLYPEYYTFKYPKAGEVNSKVSVHLTNIAKNQTVEVKGLPSYEYVARMDWTPDGKIWMQLLNRHQNQLDLIFVSPSTQVVEKVIQEKSDTWVDVHDYLTFIPKKNGFIWSSERSGFNHLYFFDLGKKTLSPITSGNFDVTGYYGVDAKNRVYYQAAVPTPINQQIWSVGIDGKKPLLVSGKDGVNTGAFNEACTYFLNYHSDANSPSTVTLCSSDGKVLRTLEDNAKLRKKLEEFQLTQKTFLSLPLANGISVNGWMMKPLNFDSTKKYPVLMFVYGGPGSQTVVNRWGGSDYFWHQYLCSKGYMVVSFDGRGTGMRGVAHKNATYKQLGKYEIEDQIEAAKALGKFGYVDAGRIGMYGWSFGGYMSSLAITKGADVFKSAVAVAPVINWRYYDNIYTERYMQTPQENAEGYDQNSPSTFAHNVKGNYLLIHGTADDNVHFQNSMMMVKAMVDQGIAFDFEAYPDKEHGIYGGKTRFQLFSKISQWLLTNL
jgi:dipeptidyl-peptidase-4